MAKIFIARHRLFVVALVIIFIISSMTISPIMITARAESSGDYQYTLNDDGISIKITKYTGLGGTLNIPSTLGGYPVTAIGTYSFSNVDSNITIIIPNSVITIEESAFFECERLEAVILPESVTHIGSRAFYRCVSLSNINLPSSVKHIGEEALSECVSLKAINVAPSNAYFSSQDGVLFDKNKTRLIQYPQNKSVESYLIPQGVTVVDRSAFYKCGYLPYLLLPASLIEMDINNFIEIRFLEAIDVDDNNTAFSSLDGVLFNKNKTKLIKYPHANTRDNYSIPSSVVEICDNAFRLAPFCSLTVPSGVTTIGYRAFYACEKLTHISIPDGVSYIGTETFRHCYCLTDLELPASLTSIDMQAFENCRNLTSVTIPENVCSISDYAFRYCDMLSVAYLEGNAPGVGNDVFYQCQPGFAVYYNDQKSGYTNPWCGYQTVACDPDNLPVFPTGEVKTSGDYLYWESMNRAIIKEYTGAGGEVTVPSMLGGYPVVAIGISAFRCKGNITKLTLPDSVIHIGSTAFDSCYSMESLYIPDGVTVIGSGAFFGCASLTSINLPGSLNKIESLFGACKSLKRVSIPNGVACIGQGTFLWCENLQSIVLPESIVNIEERAFEGCFNLKKVFHKGDVPEMGMDVYLDCHFDLTVYYPIGASGYTNLWHGYPTQEYDLQNSLVSTSFDIDIDNGYLKQVPLNTTLNQLKEGFLNQTELIKIYDISGVEYSGNAITTGMAVKLINSGVVKDELKVVVLGDTNGDGKISIIDYTLARLDILELKDLNNEFREGSDINGDGKISIADYTLIRLDILGLKSIH